MSRWHANNGEPRSDEAEEARTCRADAWPEERDVDTAELAPVDMNTPVAQGIRARAAWAEAEWRKP